MIKRSRGEWQALFAKHDASGLSSTEFCREHSLCPKYFSLRKRQLGWSAGRAFVEAMPAKTESQPVSDSCSESDVVSLRVVELTLPIGALSSVFSSLLR